MAFPRLAIEVMRVMRVIGPLVYASPVKGALKQALRLMRSGPTEEQRRNGISLIVGEAFNDDGGSVSSKLTTPEAYHLTALTAVEIMARILAGDFRPGFQTPSLTYGSDFILGFEAVEREDL
jgi:short subunit dehydrogenase-like uncharacterized protein